MSQLEMNEFFDSIRNPNQPHMSCILLLDTSASMEGESIHSLNEAIARFKYQVCLDEETKHRVDVAIVTFGETVEVISDFKPVEDMPILNLVASGRTPMAEAIQTAVNMVKNRAHQYSKVGAPYYVPWIFMITDGASTSEESEMVKAAERIRSAETGESSVRLKLWALGVDNYDKNELFRLTNRVIELREHDFTDMFVWLSQSMVSISHSQVGDTVPLDDLPENARKAKSDRAIDEGWW